MNTTPVRVAVVQAEPVWLDLAATVEKTCQLITEAAQAGARLVAFPECWVPGYPAWIWARPVDPVLATQYIRQSLAVDSTEMRTICESAARNAIVVVLGFSERDNHSLYISQAIIDATGSIRMRRRKLKPTHMERTVFGDASGASLVNVVDLDGVGKVGALSCWEHIQPLLKYHTYSQMEEIHVASWPPLHPHPGGMALWSMSTAGCMCQSQTYAIESGAFVLHATAVLTQPGIDRMDTSQGAIFSTPGGGASAVIAPDGRKLAGDLGETEEGLVLADLDMNMILGAKSFVDVCGHYSRPDMLWLGVDKRDRQRVMHHNHADETAV